MLIVDTETHNHPIQEPVFTIFLSLCIEIFTRVKNKLIFAADKSLALQQGLLTAAICIGDRVGDGVGLSRTKKFDTDRGPGAAIGDIQYMCR